MAKEQDIRMLELAIAFLALIISVITLTVQFNIRDQLRSKITGLENNNKPKEDTPLDSHAVIR